MSSVPTLSSSPAPSPSPSKEALAAEKAEKRKKLLSYGTDTEVLGLIGSLTDEKEDGFNGLLLETLVKTRNPALKKGILDFFKQREWLGAQEEAAKIIDRRDDEDSRTVSAAIDYGSAVKSALVLESAKFSLDEGGKDPFLLAAIRLAGRAGSVDHEARLLSLYDDVDTSSEAKEAIILALGEMKVTDSGAALLERIATNKDEKKIARTYAVASLAKARGEASAETIVPLVADQDPNVRTQALTVLGDFAGVKEARAAIADGLRDSYDPARMAAVKSAGKSKADETVDSLAYRADQDSNAKIREEAVKSLAEIGNEPAWTAIDALLGNANLSEAMRLAAITVIVQKERKAAYPKIAKALDKESGPQAVERYRRIAQIVGEKAGPGFEAPVESFLKNSDFIVRLYGVAWIKRNSSAVLRPLLESLKDKDPSDQVRKRAAEALLAY
jgi:HEAT repeat protein